MPPQLGFMSNRVAKKPKASLIGWVWLLLTAPGQAVVLHSPLTPSEVLRRLRIQASVTRANESGQIALRLKGDQSDRRFFAWIEPDNAGGTQISGQMRTPLRVAAIRLAISVVLWWLAFLWFAEARIWLGVLFTLGGTGFLLLSQYQRLIGQDLRKNLKWLRQVADAQ